MMTEIPLSPAEYRQQMILKNINDPDYVLMLSERGDRPGLALKYLKAGLVMDPGEFIRNWWEDTEFPMYQDSVWRKVFKFYPKEVRIIPIRIYRGGPNWTGFSWTTRQDKAEWFKTRLDPYKRNVIWTAVVNPKRIIFETNDRNESEVVIQYWYKDSFIQEPTELKHKWFLP